MGVDTELAEGKEEKKLVTVYTCPEAECAELGPFRDFDAALKHKRDTGHIIKITSEKK